MIRITLILLLILFANPACATYDNPWSGMLAKCFIDQAIGDTSYNNDTDKNSAIRLSAGAECYKFQREHLFYCVRENGLSQEQCIIEEINAARKLIDYARSIKP